MKRDGTASQAAEKTYSGRKKHTSGAKAQTIFNDVSGTTEQLAEK